MAASEGASLFCALCSARSVAEVHRLEIYHLRLARLTGGLVEILRGRLPSFCPGLLGSEDDSESEAPLGLLKTIVESAADLVSSAGIRTSDRGSRLQRFRWPMPIPIPIPMPSCPCASLLVQGQVPSASPEHFGLRLSSPPSSLSLPCVLFSSCRKQSSLPCSRAKDCLKVVASTAASHRRPLGTPASVSALPTTRTLVAP
ncbi:hypothetical protein BD414DRAFT_160513 [Trametes punicea]|nr:hypothetical protein BD414DRAFT_160513 [Trametes punicea]